ncbi:MAG: hypothetical protein DME46_10095 [Verrucomicrobia bacterium]|nr:MAG: hypothetical protein DME46_10095 [Verrucomicrobiota bacterium]
MHRQLQNRVSGKSTRLIWPRFGTWSADDLNFFLHGSMGTEVVPEPVLRAFITTYPDLFPTSELSHLGLIPDNEFGWPIGFSRKTFDVSWPMRSYNALKITDNR